MFGRILRLSGLFFTEIWTNNLSVAFYCFYLCKGTWRFPLYDGNYEIAVLLRIAQAREGRDTPAYYRWVCRMLLLPRSRFCLVTQTKGLKTFTLWPIPPPPPHPMAGTSKAGARSGLLVISTMTSVVFRFISLKVLPGHAVFSIHMLEGVVEE